MSSPQKRPRGRPKTFDKAHVIDVAMQAYWQEGQAQVSLNSVCQRAGVSKPSLYSAFGNEDGLKHAVLCNYHAMTLAPLHALLADAAPFQTTLDALAEYVLRDHGAHGMPEGCLFVDMCQSKARLGTRTGAQLDAFQAASLKTYETWFAKAEAAGEVTMPVSPREAALYLDAQIASLMTMQRQGAAPEDQAMVFQLALSIFK